MGKLKTLLLGLVVAMSVMLTGCQKPEQLADGYQFGDGTQITLGVITQVAEYRHKYCVEGDQTARVLLVSVVRSIWPDYPVDGICSDGDELSKALASYAGKGDEILKEPDG